MNTKLAQNSTAHPQTVEIPAPLEIHPSIPADLAAEMLRVADLFHREPNKYRGTIGLLDRNGCGCICAHISGCWRNGLVAIHRWPTLGEGLLQIFLDAANRPNDAAWAIARIEHFLRTAE